MNHQEIINKIKTFKANKQHNLYMELPLWLQKRVNHFNKNNDPQIRSNFNLEHYIKVAQERGIPIEIKCNF